MQIWLALIVAPILALLDQSVSFALVHWSCAHQNTLALHGVHLLFLILTVAVAVAAWQRWRDTAGAKPGDTLAQTHFLAGVATASAALSALAVAAMWIPAWMISSCIS